MKRKLAIFTFVFVFILLYAAFFIFPRATFGDGVQIEGTIQSIGAHQSATGSSVFYVVEAVDRRLFRVAPFLKDPLTIGDRVSLELKDRILFSDSATFITKIE